MLKLYRVSVDITMSKDIYVYAENEEDAKKMTEECVEKDSYYYAAEADSFVNCEVTDIMEEEIH